jgi:hypothetical protein
MIMKSQGQALSIVLHPPGDEFGDKAQDHQ